MSAARQRLFPAPGHGHGLRPPLQDAPASRRRANDAEPPLEVIEVQSGAYLGEDDIVRFDDVYGREDSP